MNKHKCILALLLPALIALMSPLRAQMVLSGTVEYERKMNVHAMNEGNSWFEKWKSKVPKFHSTYYTLIFDTGKSYFCAKPDNSNEGQNWWEETPAQANEVYTQFSTGRVTALKTIYEKKFLIADSIRETVWKEKNEVRIIAGYTCHKAVSIICDSVYVVAFYADDLPATGGPEMFAGLPGLILELAVPRLHTIWTAIKVTPGSPPPADFKIPTKGKLTKQADFFAQLKSSFKDWGADAAISFWWCAL